MHLLFSSITATLSKLGYILSNRTTSMSGTNHTAVDICDSDHNTHPQSCSMTSESHHDRFKAVFETVRGELLAHFEAQHMPADAVEWYRNVLEYNVPNGKLNRGIALVDTVAILRGRTLTDDEYFKAATMGWCVEMLQACSLIADDIMDASTTRRGQACWYRVGGVGMSAINDALMLESSIYHILKVYFRSDPYYVDVLELFHDITLRTEMGQLLDLITTPLGNQIDLVKFSQDRYHLIAIYKTAYYSFYLPVALAMRICGIPDHIQDRSGSPIHPYQVAMDILVPLGEYFQVQDDFLDFAGDPAHTGKFGTDIVDNKFSWVINSALSCATSAQREILEKNYGRKDYASESNVKMVFEELNIQGMYKVYEENVVRDLTAKIDQIVEVENGLKREILYNFLRKVYKRTK